MSKKRIDKHDIIQLVLALMLCSFVAGMYVQKHWGYNNVRHERKVEN